jgi:hypothetical protein
VHHLQQQQQQGGKHVDVKRSAELAADLHEAVTNTWCTTCSSNSSSSSKEVSMLM